jgi:hypothetical protein
MSKLWLKWALNCGFGELIGIGVAGAIAFTLNYFLPDPTGLGGKIFVLIIMMFAGAFEGFVLGMFQWRILVKKFHNVPAKEWIFFTMLIAIIGWFLGMLPSLFLNADPAAKTPPVKFDSPLVFLGLSAVAGVVLGTLFGLFQWFSLRKYAHKAQQWITANALGWGAGMTWIFVFASIPNEESSLLFNILVGTTGGILAGLSVGIITGYYFLRLSVK